MTRGLTAAAIAVLIAAAGVQTARLHRLEQRYDRLDRLAREQAAAPEDPLRTRPGRLERLECGQPFGVFVDYAHTPHALETALTTLRRVTTGRVICVFGAGGDRDAAKRPLMGTAAARLADHIILTSDNPRSEDPAAIADDILDRVERREQVDIQLDRRTAIHQALASAQPGDTVLIAGKGHEQVQIIGEERLDFDDASVARQWLYEQASELIV